MALPNLNIKENAYSSMLMISIENQERLSTTKSGMLWIIVIMSERLFHPFGN